MDGRETYTQQVQLMKLSKRSIGATMFKQYDNYIKVRKLHCIFDE